MLAEDGIQSALTFDGLDDCFKQNLFKLGRILLPNRPVRPICVRLRIAAKMSQTSRAAMEIELSTPNGA